MDAWLIARSDVLRELADWECAVTTLEARITSDTEAPLTRRADMYLFAVAVVQVRQFAVLAAKVLADSALEPDDAVLGHLETAIKNFDARVPDIRDIRNVVAHYDAILAGEGRNKSLRAGTPADHAYGPIQPFKPSALWVDATDGRFHMHVAPTPGRHMLLDIVREAESTRTLASAVQSALSAKQP
jgi:hypothetical protein